MAAAAKMIQTGFWQGRKVLLTGHTGFKGAWMSLLLQQLGADVTGIALKPDQDPALWEMIAAHFHGASHIADMRDLSSLTKLVQRANPEIVIHMAAQAKVREGVHNPVVTFSTNVMGTVNLFEALREGTNLLAVLVVTSDKVYRNDNGATAFCESDALGGSDPYSASKAACEHVTRSYSETFFRPKGVAVASARGGNVIAGGDWTIDRLVPDVYRAIIDGKALVLRYPNASRPWQHVLDCISGYLMFAEFLATHRDSAPAALNFGPAVSEYPTVSQLADAIARAMGADLTCVADASVHVEEKQTLALNTGLARQVLGWQPRIDMPSMIELTAEWYAAFFRGEDAFSLTQSQIGHFLSAYR